MNIINKLKEILEASPYIPSVNIDYAENTMGNFGLYSAGEALIKETITGNKTYNANFVLYFCSNSEDDFNRINNTGLINKICSYLNEVYYEDIKENNEKIGTINNILCSNGMLFNVPGSVNDGYIYQIQIKLTYTEYPADVTTEAVPGDEQPEVPPEEQPETPQIPILTVDGYDIHGLDDSFDEVVYFKGSGEYGWSSDDIRPLEYFKEHGIRCCAVIRRRGDVGYYLGSPELDYFDESDTNYMPPAPFDVWLPLPDYIN